MSATNATETALLSLIFTATAWADMAENDATSPQTAFYLSLHTADPTDGGDQTSNEAAYTGYSRVSINRNTSDWTVTGATATNDNEVAFGECTASPGSNLTYMGIGKSSSGAGTLLFVLALDDPIVMQVGAVPIFSAGEIDFTCD